MSISRRHMIKTGALAGAASMVPEFVSAASSTVRVTISPAVERAASFPTRSSFAAQVDSMFSVRGRSLRPMRLRLAGVDDLPSAKATGTSGHEETFAVHFEGPVTARLGQGTYHLSHGSLGDLEMFLVPIERPGKLQVYEAIFNRQTA